ncbi:hypothetical protein [Nocardia sp. NPDC005745]|uniref:phage tail protein n=1 Tax=Nocardia sp. NPDC005745 TaxID=3157061 RepID=UPI0033D1DECE
MTQPGISIPITADGDGLDAELRRVVLEAIRDVQRELDANPLDIPVYGNFDGDDLWREIDRELRDIERIHDPRITIGGEFHSAGLISEIDTAIAGAGRNIQVGANFDIDAAQLAALQGIDALGDKNIHVKLDIDTDAALLAAVTAVQGFTDKTVNFKLAIDVDAAQLAAVTAVRQVADRDVRIRIGIDVPQAEAERLKAITPALRSLRTLTDRDIRIRVRLDMNAAELQRLQAIAPALRSLRGLSDRDVRIRIDLRVDEAQLRRVAELMREVRSHTATIRVNTNADDATARTERLRASLGGLGVGVGAIAGITAAIAAIGGAAGAAAGAVGGLVVGLGALGPAAGAGIATAVVAMQGIKDAFKSLSDMSDNAGSEASDQAERVSSAMDALKSAQDSARSAADSYTESVKDQEEANQELARSYETAADNLEDLTFKQRGAVIDQKEALLDLREAQKAVGEAARSGDPDKYQRAVTRLQRAQLNYDKSITEGQRTQEQFNDAQAKGIENSDAVVAAKAKQAAADARVADSARQVQRANEQVTKAQEALTKAQTEGSPSAKKFQEAMAKLAPSAREFVLAAQAAKPAWEDVRKSVQQTAFEGLGGTLTDLAHNVLPTLGEGMRSVAGEFNAGAKGFAGFLQSGEGLAGLKAAFAGAQGFMHGLREESTGFLAGLSQMTQAAAPFAESIGRAFGSIGTEIGAALSQISESGLLGQVMEGMATAIRGLGPLLGDLIRSFSELGARVLPALGPLFESIGQALVAIAPALGDLGAIFAESLTAIIPSLSLFIRDLTEGLQPVLPIIALLLKSVFDALRPLIEPLAEITVAVGGALISAVQALAPALPPLADAFVALVNAVTPIIPLIADNLAQILIALAPAITDIFNALGPLVAIFAEEMQPVIRELIPILAETATIIGKALADALVQIAPMLPDLVQSFGDLLIAVAPLLPEIARFAAEVLPPLVQVLVDLTPVIVKVIDAFTWLVEQTLPVLITAIQGASQYWQDQLTAMGDVVTWLTDTVFPLIGKALDKVQGWFESGVDGIAQKWGKLREAAAVPVRFVVNQVWNEGLLKAWNTAASFLPGIKPMEPVTLGFRTGGAVFGAGTGTSDSIPAWLSNNEHVVTAMEVLKAGGHNILYAIRDMISRGVPFTWDNGRIISELGRGNLDAYGAAVRAKGIGNVNPEGLFDPLLRFAEGGAVLPWMHQLLRGHEFARAQNGKPYQWAGPRWVGDSFDCSGFMGSILAAILGGNPWRRYWATSSFSGYPQVGAQGLVRNLTDGVGMLVGITDDPGGPGGGHTAGELRGIPELGIPSARVESGGALGDVHYGRGTPVNSFASLYGLPIGANGFFQPSTGGSVGPSPDEQRGFVEKQIARIFREITDPIRGEIEAAVGAPPPEWRRIPPEYLTTLEDKTIQHLGGLVGGLGDVLPGVWSKAQELAGRAFDALTPFDTGGIASGVGFMPKNTIQPERVLSPEQTKLFEALVLALQKIAGAGATFNASVIDALGDGIGRAVTDTIQALVPPPAERVQREQPDTARMLAERGVVDEQGRVRAETAELMQRTESDRERVILEQTEQLKASLTDIAGRLTNGALVPIVQSAMDAALGVVKGWLGAGFEQVTDGTDRTTQAVENIPADLGDGAAPPPFGAPGSAFDAVQAISDAVVQVANTATQAFNQVAQDIARAALEQRPSRVQNSKGTLGRDISGGPLVDLIVRLTGVEIEIRDNLVDTLAEVREMRGDLSNAFDSSGRIVADTAELMQRNESSRELVISEMARLNRELMKAVLRYLVLSVLLPILTAILGAMIQLAVTAIGAAIGSIIPGIGTLIGAAIGAVVGAALAGAAAVFTSVLAVGAGAAIDSFDSGGVASGIGFLPKNTIAPERVLSPRQTESFDRLVAALEGQRGNRSVHAPITVYSGPGAGQDIQNRLLTLL